MILIVFLIIALVVGLMLLMVNWSVHISQVKDFCNVYGYGNYSAFLKEFKKYEWSQNGWSNSLFNYNENSKVHANVFEFQNKGMIMRTPIDYLLCCMFIKKYIKQTFHKKNIIKWQ